MSMLRMLAGVFGPSQSISESGGWFTGFFGGKTDSGLYVTERLALSLPVVYACVSIIADSIAMLPVVVERVTTDSAGRPQREPQIDHPVSILLNRRPNKYMTPYSYRQTNLTHALMYGNGYATIRLDGNGAPIDLIPQPSSVQPFFKDASADYPDLYYRLPYASGGAPELPANQIFHLRGFTLDGICGISPLTNARNAVGWGLAMEKYGNKFFANDARSGGYLKHPNKLSPEAYKRLQESAQSRFGGLENAHTVKILEEGMEFQENTIPPEDAQFLGSRDFQIAEIARLYRVPLVLLQSMAKSTTWGSGIEQILLGFVRWTLQPWLTQYEQEASLKLLTDLERRQGLVVRVNVDVLLRGDSAARAAWYKAMSDIRALLPNEIRAAEGLNPLPSGGEFAPVTASAPASAPANPPAIDDDEVET